MSNLAARWQAARMALLIPANDVERAQRNAMVLLAGAACTLLPHFSSVPRWVAALAAVLLIYRAWLTLMNKAGPPKWLLVVAATLAGFAIWRTIGAIVGREAGVAFLVLLAGFKLLEMRARRDLFVVVFLCFFLLLTQFLVNQSFTVFLTGMLAVAVLVGALTLFHAGAAPTALLASSLKDALKTLAIAAPLALVAFLLFPRVSSPLWGMPQDAFTARTGLSDSMSPGSITRLAQSDELAFRVRFEGQIPPQNQRYFRGPVLSHFDGQTWRPISELGRTAMPAMNMPADARRVRQEIMLEPQQRAWLFALEHVLELPVVDGQPARITREGTLLARQLITEKVRYNAVSAPQTVWPAGNKQPMSKKEREIYADIRPDPDKPKNPRTLEFAMELRRQINAPENDPMPLIDAVLQHFRTQGFSYTLEPPELTGDTVDQFLFESKAGFCEHYAQAFVLLMRAMDVPSRVVTGYLGGEVNPVDNILSIRQMDAHAWAEVWIDGTGWLRVDPTAAVDPTRIDLGFGAAFPQRSASRIAGMNAPAWMTLAGNWMEAAGTFWNSWVVGFGREKQLQLFGSLGMPDMDWRQLAAWLLGAGSAAMGLIWLASRPKAVRPSDAARLRADLMRPFDKPGLAAEPQEDLRTWSRRIDKQLSASERSLVQDAVLAFEVAIYAPSNDPAAALRQVRRQITQLRTAISLRSAR